MVYYIILYFDYYFKTYIYRSYIYLILIVIVLTLRPPDHSMRTAIWKDLLYGSRTDKGEKQVIEKHTTTSFSNEVVDGNITVEAVGTKQKTEVSESAISSIIQMKKKNGNILGTNNTSRIVSTGLCLSSDVDIAAIASKYELTGGFIKNAVLSALLSAISRATDKEKPELCQVS